MSKQMKDLIWALEQEEEEKGFMELLDELYEEEQLLREATEYGNYSTSRNNNEMYMAIEYDCLIA